MRKNSNPSGVEKQRSAPIHLADARILANPRVTG